MRNFLLLWRQVIGEHERTKTASKPCHIAKKCVVLWNIGGHVMCLHWWTKLSEPSCGDAQSGNLEHLHALRDKVSSYWDVSFQKLLTCISMICSLALGGSQSWGDRVG